MTGGVEVIIAGWFVSAVLTKLVNLSCTYLKNQKEWHKVEKIKRRLPQIEGVVIAAEKRQITYRNPRLKKWLLNLNDALHEADDVVDELEYLRIKEEVHRKNICAHYGQESNFEVSLCSSFASYDMADMRFECEVEEIPDFRYLSLSSRWISRANVFGSNSSSRSTSAVTGRREEESHTKISHPLQRVVNQDPTLKRLKAVVKKIDRIIAGIGPFLKLVEMKHSSISNSSSSRHDHRSRGPLLTVKVVGREEERRKLLNQLGSRRGENVSVIAIVGEGGVGKTQLAKLVCDNQTYQWWNIWWVTVSNDFDVDLLTKKIYRTAFKREPFANDFDVIKRELKTKLESVKFLLVLDDVWNDNLRSWSTLISPILKYGMPGSKILVTTRLQTVVQMVKTTNDPICLNRLEEGVYWELFREICIPDPEDQEKHPELLEVGKKIAKKLKGSPIAAKVVGGMLNDNLTERYWNSINETDMHNFHDIMSILKLSYLHLPPYLQPLFRYCSIFPPDYAFRKKDLVCLWVAAGLIRQQNGQEEDVEDLGHRYFEDLLKRSFFTQYEFSDTDYSMHDLLHDLADDVSVGECCRVSDDRLVDIPTTTQHLSVVTCDIDFFQKISQVKHLRTLHLSFDSSDIPDSSRALHQMFKSLTSIRVLNLSRTRVKQSICIENMIHLRYLNTEYPNIWTSVSSLYFLQFLTVNPPFFEYVPTFDVDDLGNLTMLRHFKFALKKTEGYRISELRDLVELRSLEIENLENANSFEEAAAANMKGKPFIKELRLSWNSFKQSKTAENVFDGLEPHVDLKKMEISGYKGFRSPSWLGRGLEIRYEFKLEEIYISNCSNWKDMSFLQHLPFLRVLRISYMGALNRIGTVEVAHGCQPFPKLRTLIVWNCPMLETLPPLPLGLKKLILRDLPLLTTLPKWRAVEDDVVEEESDDETSLLCELFIWICGKLISLEEGLLQKNVKLHYLKRLIIWDCENLVYLPVHGFVDLKSLESLTLYGCPKLVVPMPTKRLISRLIRPLRGDDDDEEEDYNSDEMEI